MILPQHLTQSNILPSWHNLLIWLEWFHNLLLITQFSSLSGCCLSVHLPYPPEQPGLRSWRSSRPGSCILALSDSIHSHGFSAIYIRVNLQLISASQAAPLCSREYNQMPSRHLPWVSQRHQKHNKLRTDVIISNSHPLGIFAPQCPSLCERHFIDSLSFLCLHYHPSPSDYHLLSAVASWLDPHVHSAPLSSSVCAAVMAVFLKPLSWRVTSHIKAVSGFPSLLGSQWRLFMGFPQHGPVPVCRSSFTPHHIPPASWPLAPLLPQQALCICCSSHAEPPTPLPFT